MASTAPSTDHRRDRYMPLKLKSILFEHDLLQADLCRAVHQMNGRPLSKTAGGYITNFGEFPKASPRHSIEEQIRAFLRAGGVPEAAIACAFEPDGDAQAAHERPPMGRPARPHAEPRPAEALPDDYPYVEPQMLSPLAKKHFRLFRDPFNIDPESTDDVFRGPDQEYAAECLWEAVRNNRLFALVGESGSGKTTLLDDLKDRIRRERLPVRIIQPEIPDKAKLTSSGILEAIVRDMDPYAALRRTTEGLTRQAHQLLANSAETGANAMLLFEEAHDLSIHALKQLKRFHEMKTGWKRLLSIVLIGQPELMAKVGEHAAKEAREVAQRLETVKLLPLDEALEDYVAHKLARANAPRSGELFAPDTWAAVRAKMVGTVGEGSQRERVSLAYPLRVNNLLVMALNTAADMGAAKVDANIVRGC